MVFTQDFGYFYILIAKEYKKTTAKRVKWAAGHLGKCDAHA